MPNKRKVGKVKVSFWLMERQRDALQMMADADDINMTEMIQEMIEAYASYRGIKISSPEVEGAIKRKENKGK